MAMVVDPEAAQRCAAAGTGAVRSHWRLGHRHRSAMGHAGPLPQSKCCEYSRESSSIPAAFWRYRSHHGLSAVVQSGASIAF